MKNAEGTLLFVGGFWHYVEKVPHFVWIEHNKCNGLQTDEVSAYLRQANNIFRSLKWSED